MASTTVTVTPLPACLYTWLSDWMASTRSIRSSRQPCSRRHSRGVRRRMRLWKQFHVCDCHLIRHIFIPILHRLGRTPQIFFKAFLLTAKACQGQPRRQYYRTAALYPPLPQFFCDGCKCQQVVTATRRFIPLQRLPSCPAHIPAPLVFQHILPGVGLMLICRDPRGKHTMPCFHGIVAMVNAKDLLFDFSLSFLSLWKTPFSFPQPVIYPGWGYGGGVKRSTPRFPGASVSNLCLQKGTLPPGHGTCKKIAPAVAGACSIYMIVSLCTWETEQQIIRRHASYALCISIFYPSFPMLKIHAMLCLKLLVSNVLQSLT